MTGWVRTLACVHIDLTVRDAEGNDHDVAITAPAGTTFGAISDMLANATRGARPVWIGNRALTAGSELGRAPLVSGAICSVAPGRNAAVAGRLLGVVGGPGAGRHMTIGTRPVIAGRDPGCDLVLPDPQASRRHARFCLVAGRLAVTDLRSTHGTWVDGVEIEAPAEVQSHSMVRVGDSFLAEICTDEPRSAARAGPDGRVHITSGTREAGMPEARVVILPPPPALEHAARIQWVACLFPAIAGVALAWLMHSVLFLAFAALSPMAMIASSFGQRWQSRRTDRRTAATHRREMARLRDHLADAIIVETVQRSERDPDPVTISRIAETRSGRLWQRIADDQLRVRLGLGPAPSLLRVEERNRTRSAATLPAVPHTVDLSAGPLAVIGPRRLVVAVGRWVMAQIATLVSPADLELVVLALGPQASDWQWVRWFPHVGSRIATAQVALERILSEMEEELDARRAEIGEPPRSRRRRSWLLLLVDGELDAAHCARIAALLAEGPALGVTALILSRDAASSVAPSAHLVTPSGDAGTAVRCRTPAPHFDDRSEVIADQVDPHWAERIARALAALRDARRDRSSVLPRECHLAELIGATELTPEATRRRWAAGDGGASTVLGVGPDGPLRLDLARDGPHLLVAGTTGAGKSELLQTLVVGLAIEYPPSAMSFLLVDYKGGAAFAGCDALPHTIGLVTDLDDRMTVRVLASLDSEIRRREALLAAAGARDLSSLRGGGKTLARLVIVVDEFATLVEELPGFVAGLVSIAQRGRSLGMHLVLATQRPAGVVSPEIRANMTLRVCLRVTGAGESTDVIDAPHAASVDRHTPGRAFLRAGPQLLPFQTARVAAAPMWDRAEIAVTPLDAWRRPAVAPVDSTRPADLSRLVEVARLAATGATPPHRPWLPPLAERVDLDTLDPESGQPGRVPIGLLDLPREQRQIPLTIDLRVGGTVLVAGGGRSGRTTLLRTLALSAARRLRPDQLHVHAIDAGGSGLAELAALPHAGTIVTARDGFELAARLVIRLARVFADGRDGGVARPAVLFVVDGWEGFVAGAEEYDGGRTVDRLHTALGDAPSAGATVVITGGRAVLAPRLATHAATRLALACHDPADYAAVGVDARSVPVFRAGRGLRAGDGAEFQIAVTEMLEQAGPPDPAALRLRTLPTRVALADLPAAAGHVVLGTGGDEAGVVRVTLGAGAGRVLVAGPPGSGRSQFLITVLHQSLDRRLVIAAPARSPLAIAAARHGVRVLMPRDSCADDAVLQQLDLLLLDDVETFADTELGEVFTRWVRDGPPGLAVCAAGRSDALAITFRGLGAEMRRARCGVLLQPGAGDGALFSARLPRARAAQIPGRGLLFPDPAWALSDAPIPIQLAVNPCADTCGPSAGRRSP